MFIYKNFDLSILKQALLKKNIFSKDEIDQRLKIYECFLCLKYNFPNEVLSPEYNTDKIWHEHILATYHYNEFCQKEFGYFLHHTPKEYIEHNDTQADENVVVQNTYNLMHLYFPLFCEI